MRWIFVLEDNGERIERFTRAINHLPGVGLRVWRSATEMIDALPSCVSDAAVISLDHDLYPASDTSDDPGDGLMVAKRLAEWKPVAPIIVHTSNATRGDWMVGELELAGCQVIRVGAIGHDWIEADWLAVVEELLQHEGG